MARAQLPGAPKRPHAAHSPTPDSQYTSVCVGWVRGAICLIEACLQLSVPVSSLSTGSLSTCLKTTTGMRAAATDPRRHVISGNGNQCANLSIITGLHVVQYILCALVTHARMNHGTAQHEPISLARACERSIDSSGMSEMSLHSDSEH